MDDLYIYKNELTTHQSNELTTQQSKFLLKMMFIHIYSRDYVGSFASPSDSLVQIFSTSGWCLYS